ncbi:MAG: PDZ domain-containing protein [Flavobacteriales bacterium]|nr:PDZ domain-containing protein [Flavobacteriales bacterium]
MPLFRTPLLLVALALAPACTAQPATDLPRRVFLGIRMENLTDDLRRIMGVGDTRAVLVSEVLPGGSGEAAGWKRGDLLAELGGVGVGATDAGLLDKVCHHRYC